MSLHHDRRNTLHLDRSREPVDTAARPAQPHHVRSENKRNLIYLIYTPTTTNESTHVPSEVQTPRENPSPTHPYLSEGTQLPREKERSGSPLLTRALADKKC